MKQYITVEQLLEMSEEQQARLREWWEPKDADWFYGTHGGRRGTHFKKEVWILSPYTVDSGIYGASLEESPPDEDALPLLSIGQMIELLKSKTPDFDIHRIDIPCGMPDRNYMIVLKGHYNNLVFDANELADALWRAVKYII